MSESDDKPAKELRRFLDAKKLKVATLMRAGEDVPAAELDRIARLEVRIATLEQFNRLRDLTRQPGLARPPEEAVIATATKRKRTRRAARPKANAN